MVKDSWFNEVVVHPIWFRPADCSDTHFSHSLPANDQMHMIIVSIRQAAYKKYSKYTCSQKFLLVFYEY